MVKALIEVISAKTKIPAAKVFLQSVLYEVTSQFELGVPYAAIASDSADHTTNVASEEWAANIID